MTGATKRAPQPRAPVKRPGRSRPARKGGYLSGPRAQHLPLGFGDLGPGSPAHGAGEHAAPISQWSGGPR